MTLDELWNTNQYISTPHHTYILVQLSENQAEALELLDSWSKTVKGQERWTLKVRLASRPALYSGQPTFLMPLTAFDRRGNEDLHGITTLQPWYLKVMDAQTKRNLNLIF